MRTDGDFDIMNKMNTLTLFTVGYEGRHLDDFIGELRTHGIERVIDVREIPISRKPGFSKTVLRTRLGDSKIEYVHLKALGSPSVIRHRLHADEDFGAFVQAYSAYLATQDDFVRSALELAKTGPSCLLCFERKSEFCHRSIVARRMAELSAQSISIQNL